MSIDPLPEIVHARVDDLSLVFDTTRRRIPCLVYWGPPLDCETPDTLRSIVLASKEPLAGNAPDEHLQIGMIPLASDGWNGRPGLVGSRAGGIDWSPRFTLEGVSFSAEEGAQEPPERIATGEEPPAGGEPIADGHVLQCGPGTLTFDLVDERAELSLSLSIDLFAEGLFRAKASVTNDSSVSYHLQELGISLPVPLEANEILDMTGRWGKERHPQRQDVTVSCHLRESWRGRTGFDAPDMLMVGKKGFSFRSGSIWGLHTAFSGNHRSWVQRLPSGVEVIGGSEALLPGEIVLDEGRTYTTPYFYAVQAEGLDDAANRVQSWLRHRPNHVSSDRPVTLNVWEAVYFRHELPELKRLADTAARIGVERYVLDDGWFRGRRDDWKGLGDWYVDEDIWPDGLGPLVDHVHDLGMQFGLWFEPEMVNVDSDIAHEHPEWIMGARSAGADDLPLEWRHQQVLNISIPAVREYIEERVVSLVKEYGIDYIKWDHNRDLIDAGDLTAGGRPAVHSQTLAVYELFDSIRRHCPGLEIESCSSGGGRIDLEVIQHTDRVWVSDCIDPVERQEMVRWLSQILPPELMGTHVASPHSHTTGRWSPLSFRGATAIWGHFGIEWDIANASAEELDELSQWISFYKTERRFLHNGQMVRCETQDPSIWLQGIVAPDRRRALFQLVTRERPSISPWGRMTFAGLDGRKNYRVRPLIIGAAPSGLQKAEWFGLAEDTYVSTNQGAFPVGASMPGVVMTGQALHYVGVQTPLMHPDQSLLIEVAEEI